MEFVTFADLRAFVRCSRESSFTYAEMPIVSVAV
jgi:hypothetical protein